MEVSSLALPRYRLGSADIYIYLYSHNLLTTSYLFILLYFSNNINLAGPWEGTAVQATGGVSEGSGAWNTAVSFWGYQKCSSRLYLNMYHFETFSTHGSSTKMRGSWGSINMRAGWSHVFCGRACFLQIGTFAQGLWPTLLSCWHHVVKIWSTKWGIQEIHLQNGNGGVLSHVKPKRRWKYTEISPPIFKGAMAEPKVIPKLSQIDCPQNAKLLPLSCKQIVDKAFSYGFHFMFLLLVGWSTIFCGCCFVAMHAAIHW